MALTQDGYELFCDTLTEYILSCVKDNQGPCFERWLIADADLDFQHGYESRLSAVYSGLLTDRTRTTMRAASKSLVYALQAYNRIHSDDKGALHFVGAMLENQLSKFNTDYVDVLWFYGD